jgi:hypothetical protein
MHLENANSFFSYKILFNYKITVYTYEKFRDSDQKCIKRTFILALPFFV